MQAGRDPSRCRTGCPLHVRIDLGEVDAIAVAFGEIEHRVDRRVLEQMRYEAEREERRVLGVAARPRRVATRWTRSASSSTLNVSVN